MSGCDWPSCPQNTFGDRFCAYHAKVVDGLIDARDAKARVPAGSPMPHIAPRRLRERLGVPASQVISDEQAELASVLLYLGVDEQRVRSAMEKDPQEHSWKGKSGRASGVKLGRVALGTAFDS